ncbi:MAG: L-2-amino-thiazoline-4-carboxylic acid hydrolase [Chloroflexi bacterium]|nr:L-2-amino-thiazoline-4-carboxylic acid hydrolase [Chloroflexota bacterium]
MSEQHDQQAEQRKRQEQLMAGRAALFSRLVARFGPDILAEVAQFTHDSAEHALRTADLPRRNLQGVLDALWNHITWELDYEIVEQTEQRLELRVTRCVHADFFRARDAGEIGHAFYCAYDGGFCQGLNPAIRFTRTQTLMDGDECCDHTYELDA